MHLNTYSWIVMGTLFLGIVFLLGLQTTEGFLTVDIDSLRTKRKLLQFEGERRNNDLGRVQHSNSTIRYNDADSAIRQLIPKPTGSTSNNLINLANITYQLNFEKSQLS